MKTAKYILIPFFTLLLISCGGSKKPLIVEKTVQEKVTETIRDTVFETKPDSSFYKALIDCQNGRPILKPVMETPGNSYLKAPAVELKGNILTANCYAQAQQLFAQWKETYREKLTETEVPVIVPQELNWFQKLLIKLGWILLIAIVLALAYSIFKLINKLRP